MLLNIIVFEMALTLTLIIVYFYNLTTNQTINVQHSGKFKYFQC